MSPPKGKVQSVGEPNSSSKKPPMFTTWSQPPQFIAINNSSLSSILGLSYFNVISGYLAYQALPIVTQGTDYQHVQKTYSPRGQPWRKPGEEEGFLAPGLYSSRRVCDSALCIVTMNVGDDIKHECVQKIHCRTWPNSSPVNRNWEKKVAFVSQVTHFFTFGANIDAQ